MVFKLIDEFDANDDHMDYQGLDDSSHRDSECEDEEDNTDNGQDKNGKTKNSRKISNDMPYRIGPIQ